MCVSVCVWGVLVCVCWGVCWCVCVSVCVGGVLVCVTTPVLPQLSAKGEFDLGSRIKFAVIIT